MATTSPALTIESFCDRLSESQLLDADHVLQLRQQLQQRSEPIAPAALGKWLVERELLTRWQLDELLAGRTNFLLDKYRLLERVGSGASGTVYKAEQVGMGRVVAVKVLTEELSQRPEALARFRQETRMAAALHHPNIITAYDAECDGDVHFLVMEYCEGRDLNKWIKRSGGRLPIAWACECIRQAALGLQHAHECGMIHRDIKPGNILVKAEGVETLPTAKILDLGFARNLNDEGGVRLTRSWQIFGTPDYMSPEQAESTANADIRSDIFSLGCTLFKALTGQLPFGGETPMQKLLARANRDAPLIRTVRAEIPEELAAVVARMLARSPEDRYQTPGEVAEVLRPFSLAASVSSPAAKVEDDGFGEAMVLDLSDGELEGESPTLSELRRQTVPDTHSAPTITLTTVRGALIRGLCLGGGLGLLGGAVLGGLLGATLGLPGPGALAAGTLAAAIGATYQGVMRVAATLLNGKHA